MWHLSKDDINACGGGVLLWRAWRWVSPLVTNPDRGSEQIQQIPFTNPEISPVFGIKPIKNMPKSLRVALE